MATVKTMLASVIICSALLTLAGCGSVEEVQATVTRAEKFECGDRFMCGCIGSDDYRTTIKIKDGRIDNLCAYVGEVGDSITGYWRSGHWDHALNGFHLTN